MKNAVVIANLMSIMIGFIILYGCRFESKQYGRRKMKAFLTFVHINFCLSALDILAWFLNGNAEFAKWLYIVTTFSNIGIFVLITIFAQHLYLQVIEKKQVSKLPFQIISAGSLIVAIGTCIACYKGYVTRFVNGNVSMRRDMASTR